MAVVLRTIDLSRIEAAIDDGDTAAVKRVATELGIELSHATLTRYLGEHKPRFLGALGRTVFKLIYTAIYDASGYGFGSAYGFTVLVVRTADHLVFGLQPNGHTKDLFPKTGWKIGRWYKDPIRNRPTVDAWAADPARADDALTIRITRAAEVVRETDARGARLLAAVVDDPDDDDARLVYADWLAEQGDARGELIRIQCELDGRHSRKKRRALRAREAELLSSLGPGMRAAVDHFTEASTIARGLIEGVTMSVVKLAKYGPALVAEHPIRKIRILCSGDTEYARLARMPVIPRFREIEIEGRRTPRVIHSATEMRPSQAPRLFATTRRLALSDFADPPAEWKSWLLAVDAPALAELELARVSLSLEAFELLAERHILPALRRLSIQATPFTQPQAGNWERLVAAVAALSRRPLDEFRFGCWHFDDSPLARCVRAMLGCKTLTRLEIASCAAAGDQTARAVAAGGARLEHLQLDQVSAEALAEVIEALPKLRSLSCEPTPVGREQLIEAIAGSSIKNLTWRANWGLTADERRRLAHFDLR